MFENNRKIKELDRRLYRIESDNNHCSTEQKVTITENRAPTDDSIRLANEMREKALNDIIYLEHTNDNTFDYMFCIANDAYFSIVKLIAIINGKRYEVKEKVHNLGKQVYEKKEDINGYVSVEKRYNKSQLGELRLKMLAELIIKAMYEKSPEDFCVLIDKLSNSNFDH